MSEEEDKTKERGGGSKEEEETTVIDNEESQKDNPEQKQESKIEDEVKNIETEKESTATGEDVKDKTGEDVKDKTGEDVKDKEVNGDKESLLKDSGEPKIVVTPSKIVDETVIDQSTEEKVPEIVDETVLEQSTSEIGDKENLDTSEVITVDDSNDGNVPSKTVPDVVFYDSVTEEEKKFYEENSPTPESVETLNARCTACWKQVNHHVMNNIMRHPELGVAVCRSCKYFYDGDGNEEEWEKDEEGSDVFCRWCAQGGEVVGCDKCCYVFCKRCITRNLGRKKFAEIGDSEEWSCFNCDPSQIYKERALMFAIAKWAADRRNKKRLKDKLKVDKRKSDIQKKNEAERKKREEAKKKQKEQEKMQKEQEKKKKIEEEASKVENFIDENILEAFDTLNIYQKCLQDEHKKWIRIRKSMNPNNTAMVAKSLRKIYAITKQNMELLDTALVQGYGDQFPEESEHKLKVGGNIPNGDITSPKAKITPSKRKMKTTPAKPRVYTPDNDIEVEEIVVNGEPVFGSAGAMGDMFDPSMLCSVEITAERDSSATPPPAKKQKILKKPTITTPSIKKQTGGLRLSKNMFAKKKKTPMKAPVNKPESDSEIEEITIDDDDDSTSYVSQSTLDALAQQNINQKVNQFIKNSSKEKADDSFDSDVSLE